MKRILLFLLILTSFSFSQLPSSIKWWHLSQDARDSLWSKQYVDSTRRTVSDSLKWQIATDTTDLKTKTASDGRYVYLKQLSASNPNGGGWFVLKDSLNFVSSGAYKVSDRGYVFPSASAGLIWVRLEFLDGNIKRPEWWGAVPQDTINDTKAIQAALNLKGFVLLSEGRYIIDSLKLIQVTQLIGTGVGDGNSYRTTELYLASGSNPDAVIKGINFYPEPVSDMHYSSIRNLRIDGNSSNNTRGHGIKFKIAGWNVIFDNLVITNTANSAFYYGDTTGNSGGDLVKFSNITIKNAGGMGAFELHVNGGDIIFDKIKIDDSKRAFYLDGRYAFTGRTASFISFNNIRMEVSATESQTMFYFKNFLDGFVYLNNINASNIVSISQKDSGLIYIDKNSYPKLMLKNVMQKDYGDTITTYRWLIQDDNKGTYIDRERIQYLLYPAYLFEIYGTNGLRLSNWANPNSVISKIDFFQSDTLINSSVAKIEVMTATSDSSKGIINFYTRGSSLIKALTIDENGRVKPRLIFNLPNTIPASPAAGDMYYLGDGISPDTLRIYNGINWMNSQLTW